jgi:alginate O-acetyltransferase complex protein AlgI
VYIPLGGTRKGPYRQLLNILIVWFLTGFWHGANWNFIGWGLYFAALLLLEKFVLAKILTKLPQVFSRVYLLLLVWVGWVFFDSFSMAEIGHTLSTMFVFGAEGLAGAESLYYLKSYALTFVIAAVGATPLPKMLAARFKDAKPMVVAEPLAVGLLLVVVTAYLVDGSFNPFIYFRF